MSDNRVLLKGFIDPVADIDVSWVPSTVGWKVVFVLILVWGAWKSFRLFYSYKANKYRRVAVKAISRSKQDAIDKQETGDKQDLQQELRRINSVLKQVACCSYPKSKVAMLSGDEWSEFLTVSSPTPIFNHALLSQWQNDIYKASSDYDWTDRELSEIRTSSVVWIKIHTRVSND
ncbi:DUF4381 domain-containing protein [Vibrio sp. 10N.261.46.E12]|uniref:DUF4381 domain-containing protein n=2 Tax=Vibrio TaxID=662 RepID=UPI000978514B|nr:MULTISPECIES: DUF4381 domain-containing protein [unclassified Vibrio]OMO37645.1 hypothetical protein BH584_21590 [Vibrio sp. 10N.261.45.E1]PMJ19638.1 hypothetical protein BCU27_21095 [Vibrio sp. 10N.286.45.B6]PML93125.1 hypothetical protein BCT66_24720 [Vibrio sp. 10N.261.49.E11]PMM66610.1 hypothetical protein BCT48_16730 [Vibrio sp. 10N.261.46.F12]PMM86344.1 hypothetical protein BCT46_08340 [Vibrio sp. 10N.261.46.E8]